MKNQDKYALLYPDTDMATITVLAFFDTKEELEAKLHELSNKVTRLNQSYLYFSSVFDKGLLHPADYEGFQEQRRKLIDKNKNLSGYYFVQRTLPNGITISKHYMFAEDFDWQLSDWKEKGCTDIYILSEKHAYSAQYYYDRDILKRWGDKEEPLFKE